MRTFFWSDLHIGHKTLSESWRAWAGGTVESHTAWIVDHWNDTVSSEDRVIVVGDACMGVRTESVPIFGALNGTKYLIPGNHEKFHPADHTSKNPAKCQAAIDLFREHGVEVIGNLIIPGDTFGVPESIISHFPWRGTPDHSPERTDIDEFGPVQDHYSSCTVLIHGHLHAPTAFVGPRMVHVGVDAFPEGPVPAERVAELAEEARACS